MGRAILALLILIGAVLIILWIAGPNAFTRPLVFEKALRIADVKYSEWAFPRCVLEINATHVVYTCWARRCVDVKLVDGRRYWSCGINHTVIEVADLVNKRFTVYERFNLTPFGLGVFGRAVRNGTFEYRRVSLWFYPELNYSVIYTSYIPSRNEFRFQIAFFTYEEGECKGTVCYYTYRPDPGEEPRDAEEVWCRVIEEWLDINCSFVAVNPAKHCTWPEKVVMRRLPTYEVVFDDDYRKFRCEFVDGLGVTIVIYVPGLKPLDTGPRRAGVFCKPYWIMIVSPLLTTHPLSITTTFLHEFGHALGLGDLYRVEKRGDLYWIEKRSRWPPWAEQLVKNSIMGVGMVDDYRSFRATRGVSLADALVIFRNVYRAVQRYRPDVAQRIYEKLLSYGYDPANHTLVLPIDEHGEIPPPFSTVIEQGITWYEWSPKEKKWVQIFNYDLPKLLKAIARVAKQCQIESTS